MASPRAMRAIPRHLRRITGGLEMDVTSQLLRVRGKITTLRTAIKYKGLTDGRRNALCKALRDQDLLLIKQQREREHCPTYM